MEDIQKAAASLLFRSPPNPKKHKKKRNKKKKKHEMPNPLKESEKPPEEEVFDLVKMNQIVEDLTSPPDAPSNTLPNGITPSLMVIIDFLLVRNIP